MWLGQVIQTLRQNFAGARWRHRSRHELLISFVDRSLVTVSPETCEVKVENADALMFREAMLERGLVRRETKELASPTEDTPEIYGP
jgi:predicted glycosyltransferase